MLKHILLLALLFFWNLLFQEIPDAALYGALADFGAGWRTMLLVTTAALGGGLLGLAYLCTDCGLYKIAKAASVLTENICLFLLLTFGVGQALFYVTLGENLYAATGYLPPVLLFLLLLAAVQAQRVIDFNHPLRQALIPGAIAALWPIVFVIFYALVAG